VTTDGIVGSWHTEKESVTDEKKTKEKKTKEKKTKEEKTKEKKIKENLRRSRRKRRLRRSLRAWKTSCMELTVPTYSSRSKNPSTSSPWTLDTRNLFTVSDCTKQTRLVCCYQRAQRISANDISPSIDS
jgi:hypothetical protein